MKVKCNWCYQWIKGMVYYSPKMKPLCKTCKKTFVVIDL
jgi:ribosomal protein S27E